jgi:hypothetical protein
MGGEVIGELKACVPTVFRVEWPADVKANLVSEKNQNGKITNSDLEMAGLLLLWLVMEKVCGFKPAPYVALFSDNSLTVHWVRRMAAKGSLVAGQLLRALALRMKVQGVSPLTPLHIEGKCYAMTDIPSCFFGSEPKWFCKSNADLCDLFNKKFPLPTQQSWTVFHVSTDLFTKGLSILRMEVSTMEEWR